MRVAVPVWDESLRVFKNAGHTPFFAIFELAGGIFRSFNLIELRANPRVKDDHEHACESETTGKCSHEGQSEAEKSAHKEEHRTMAEIIKDCKYLMADKACKNTKTTMNDAGVEVVAAHGAEYAKDALAKAPLK
jgi:predicted Fe-Mo cluster-binding NifX family protein